MKKTTSYIYQFSILLVFVVSFIACTENFIDFDTEIISLEADIDHSNDINEDNKDSETEYKIEEFTLQTSNNAFLFSYVKPIKKVFIIKNKNYKDFYIGTPTPPPEIEA